VFIRAKVSKGNVYYQVVRSDRVDGLVRQTVLASLGTCPTIAEAIDQARRTLARCRRERRRYAGPVESFSRTVLARVRRLDGAIAGIAERVEVLERLEGELGAGEPD
jgi:hypothetical protein